MFFLRPRLSWELYPDRPHSIHTPGGLTPDTIGERLNRLKVPIERAPFPCMRPDIVAGSAAEKFILSTMKLSQENMKNS